MLSRWRWTNLSNIFGNGLLVPWMLHLRYPYCKLKIYMESLHNMKHMSTYRIIYAIGTICPHWNYIMHCKFICQHTQPAITCLKLTIETLEQGVEYIQC